MHGAIPGVCTGWHCRSEPVISIEPGGLSIIPVAKITEIPWNQSHAAPSDNSAGERINNNRQIDTALFHRDNSDSNDPAQI